MSAFEDFIQVELPRRPWVLNDPAQETIPVRRGAGPRQLEFVSLVDGQVLGKVGGVIQGVNVTGLGGKSYVHIESTPSNLWILPHNLNSLDYVASVFDENDNMLIPNNIIASDANNIFIDFVAPMIGKAVIVFAS